MSLSRISQSFFSSRFSTSDTWVPVYPPFNQSDLSSQSISASKSNLQETKEFWAKKSRASEEEVIQRSSPLKLLKVKGTSDDLTRANIPSLTKASSPPSKPTNPSGTVSPGYTIKQIVLSPGGVQSLMRPNLVPIAPTAPPMHVRQLITTSPQATNKWTAAVAGPSGIPSVTVTPSKPPLPPVHSSLPDSTATIPILPNNVTAGVRTLIYETPKQQPVLIDPSSRVPTAPGSAFIPKYTPAAAVEDVLLETLVPLPTSPISDDQYPITDWVDSEGENATFEDDDAKETRRLQKHVPSWCEGWVETAKTQTNIDPDTVFGTKLPKCDLSVIFGAKFRDNAYMRTKTRGRGSSGEWGLDVVTRAELDEYRQVMGHTQQLEAVVIIQQKLPNEVI